ncbi:MAG: PKD domain-containing protein [bacterium]
MGLRHPRGGDGAGRWSRSRPGDGGGEGDAQITATLAGVESAPASVHVTAPELVAVQIDPDGASVVVGETVQLRALGSYSDGTLEDLTEQAQWVSSAAATAAVSNAPGSRGLVSGLVLGEADIRATAGGQLSAPARITVLPIPNRAPVVRLTCPEIGREGEALQFSAAGSQDPDGEIARYTWRFGDGSPPVSSGLIPRSPTPTSRAGPSWSR